MRLPAGFLLIGLAAALLGGCSRWFSQDDHPVVMIENQSGVTVDVFMVVDGFPESKIATLGPGQGAPYERLGNCVDGFLLARDSRGREVDRSDPPICKPSRWIIAAATPSP